MTDITAQAFLEAAATAEEWCEEGVGRIDSGSISDFFYLVRPLLLAAAEQREQLTEAHEQIGVLHADNYNLSEQIATLTAEVAHQITFAKELAEEYAALEAISDAQRAQWDIAHGSIAGQSDFIRQMGTEHQHQIAELTAERDEALAKIDAISRWVNALGAGARVGSESLTIANTITDIMAEGTE